MNEEQKPLRKVAEIEILGKRYDIARNGSYALVEPRGIDAYGSAIFEEVDLVKWLAPQGLNTEVQKDATDRKLRALLDLLGDALTKLQGIGDLRRGQIGEEKGAGV